VGERGEAVEDEEDENRGVKAERGVRATRDRERAFKGKVDGRSDILELFRGSLSESEKTEMMSDNFTGNSALSRASV